MVHRHRRVVPSVAALIAMVLVAIAAGSAGAATTAGSHRPPSARTRPHISGSPQVGDMLHAHTGVWRRAARFTYRWKRCSSSGRRCKTIDRAGGQPFGKRAYLLKSSDVGHRLKLAVTGWNRWGHRTATSRLTAEITKAAGSSGGSGGSGPGGPGGSGPGGTGVSGFQSVVFWLAWDGGTLSSLPWNAVTQVDLMSLSTCISSGNPYSDCTGPTSLDTSNNGVTGISSFVSTVHAHGRLAIITIGGSTNPDWYYPCHGSNAAAFAHNLVNYMQSNGFDGVDLDIEQDPNTSGSSFSSADLQACAEDVYNDAKAVKTQAGRTPLVTSDVDPTTNFDIGQIEQPYVDQFNAMSYGATVANGQLASQIQALETQSGIPASKITEGVDIQDDPSTQADCGSNAGWAAANGLDGAMLWFGQWDAPNYQCLNAVAPYVG